MKQAERSPGRLSLSLKWQVIIFMCLLILAVAGTLDWYFFGQARVILTRQFGRKAILLAENLAHNCESALLSPGDRTPEEWETALGGFIAAVLKDPSVLHVVIADEAGNVVAVKSRPEASGLPPSVAGEMARQRALSLVTNILAVSLPEQPKANEDLLHIARPVVLEKVDKPVGSVQIIFSLASTRAEFHRSLLTGAGLTLLIIGLGIVLAFLFGQRALTPIQDMAAAAAKIAAGDLTQRVQTKRRDEIGVLAGAFNEMADSLDHMTHDLEAKVVQRTEELRRVNVELQRATQAKSEFVAGMSHELRTPLNAVIGFSEVLLEKMFGPLNAKQEEYITDILTSGRHLLSLINDVLDLAKIEAGRMDLETACFDLRPVLQHSLVMVKERALTHGIQLSVEIGEGVGLIVADERRVKQIIFNLLSNAVKFTPDKGRVGIRAGGNARQVEIAVWDTGVGIAPADKPKLFGEFQQLETGFTTKPEGTGLGLNLTRKFIELHGGSIAVESTPGQGSTFTFTLPVNSGDTRLVLPTLPAVLAAAPPRPAPGSQRHILVIEDDPKSADILRIYLTEAGYSVAVAGDATEGMAKLKQQMPDVIILDVLLPNVDGWAFLTQLKADTATKNLPVVIASIVDQKGKGLALGAADYLVKPVQKSELLHKLAALHLSVATGPKKILAIDDDPLSVELLRAALEPQGFQVLKAYGGEQGVELARSEKPDLIILDLLMPGTNGFDVLDRLRSSPDTDQMPVVLFTVKQLTPEEKQRVKGHVDAFAPKQAFDREKLVATVHQVLHNNLAEGI